MFCEKCGVNVQDGATFCQNCGNKIPVAIPPQNPVVHPKPVQPQPQQAQPQPQQAQPQPVQPQPQPVQPQPQQAQPQPVQPQLQNNFQQQSNVYQQPTMNHLEKPLSVGGFLGMFLLLMIPLVNIILLIVWAVSSDVNKNKKNFAIASLLLGIIFIVLSFLLSGILIALFASFSDSLQMYY